MKKSEKSSRRSWVAEKDTDFCTFRIFWFVWQRVEKSACVCVACFTQFSWKSNQPNWTEPRPHQQQQQGKRHQIEQPKADRPNPTPITIVNWLSVPVMTIDKHEPDEIPADDKNESPNRKEITEKITVHFMLGFREICCVTASLPMVTLVICFVSAVVFQFDDVHETHCRVFNFIPSISAITGISPNIYFWRISIALHVGPRFIIAICYKSYYEHMLSHVKNQVVHSKGTWYMNLAFWLHIVEITSLCGVTYISNRENYTLHEQVFIVFMVCSLCHMLIVIKLCQLMKNEIDVQRLPHLILIDEEKSIKYKKILFNISIISTVGLAVFFFKHRVYCHDLAFSAFAFCEYIIAMCNLAFHSTTMLDFPSEYLMIARRTTKLKLKHPTGWKLD